MVVSLLQVVDEVQVHNLTVLDEQHPLFQSYVLMSTTAGLRWKSSFFAKAGAEDVEVIDAVQLV